MSVSAKGKDGECIVFFCHIVSAIKDGHSLTQEYEMLFHVIRFRFTIRNVASVLGSRITVSIGIGG